MPLAIAVPVLVACLMVAAGSRLPHHVLDLLGVATSLTVCALAAVVLTRSADGRVVTWNGDWRPKRGVSVGIPLVADSLSAGTALLIAGLMSCALLYSWRYYSPVRGYYHALMLLFLAGMEGFVLSGDLFDMFVFFELMGIAAYALTGLKIEDPTAVQGGLNFGIVNSLGAYFSLAGIGVLYARHGQLGLAPLGQRLTEHRADALTVVALVVIVTCFLVKAAVVPFHFWLPDAHAVAPAPVCVLFSGVMVELGLYGAFRVFWTVFGSAVPHDDIRGAFLPAGVLTAVVGALMCFAQSHLKRMLAYSTIAHVGLFTTGLATLTPEGTAGVALYAAAHAGVKSALFLLVGVILARHGHVDELKLHGCGRDARFVSWLYFAAGAALAGLPPFGTALGKSVTEEALTRAGHPWGPAVFVAVSALTGGAVLRAGFRIYLGAGPAPDAGGPVAIAAQTTGIEEHRETEQLSRTPRTMYAAVLLLLAGGLAVGVLPGAGRAFDHAAEGFTDPRGYAAAVLFGTAPAVGSPHHESTWTAQGVVLGCVSTAAAVLLAAAAVRAPRAPDARRARLRPFLRSLAAVRALHSGHVGDYAAWLLFGMTALAALVGVLPVDG
ncbi:hypothetical protein AQ490_13195 [Wenjunlia vitaminophila]|uniref:NADH:quinone oxidoreductase/Mrp antiporter transmembrane domain-containing protein n=2 Tax=Wenjunlia vitaminophila TaxID=76728 RepID=A0A0T6LY43_WENVI|nr:hypothetical protein AQ490_13195 [Wenjunlia vitaminophila]